MQLHVTVAEATSRLSRTITVDFPFEVKPGIQINYYILSSQWSAYDTLTEIDHLCIEHGQTLSRTELLMIWKKVWTAVNKLPVMSTKDQKEIIETLPDLKHKHWKLQQEVVARFLSQVSSLLMELIGQENQKTTKDSRPGGGAQPNTGARRAGKWVREKSQSKFHTTNYSY